MQGPLFVIVLIAAVLSRPIEVRLWRAGRISDRTAAILLVGRFPLVCFLFALISGASLPFIVGITALAMVPFGLFYRFMLDLLREQKNGRA